MSVQNFRTGSIWKNSNEPSTVSFNGEKPKLVQAPSGRATRTQRLSVQCGVCFRPCIDIHKGKVKQIVGSTLNDSKDEDSSLVTNYESDKSAAEYAKMYKEDGLAGGHVIMLGADPLSKSAAIEALHAYPGGLQVGGGINSSNAMSYIDEGASHVIVTSYVFNGGQVDFERLKELALAVGKQRLVLDLSCRKKVFCRRTNMLLSQIDGRSSVMSILIKKCWSFLRDMLMSFWSMELTLKAKNWELMKSLLLCLAGILLYICWWSNRYGRLREDKRCRNGMRRCHRRQRFGYFWWQSVLQGCCLLAFSAKGPGKF